MTEMTEADRKRDLATHLTGVVADSYILYHTTQFCHWNVEGPQFYALHEMFEKQYRNLAEAIDLIAEQIRTLGMYTPGTLSDYLKWSRLEQDSNLRGPSKMLRRLISDHEQVVDRIRAAIKVAERVGDEATLDLLVERLRAHEKDVWMLKSQASVESRQPELVSDKGKGRTVGVSTVSGTL